MITKKDIRKGIYLKDKTSGRIGCVKNIVNNIISCEMEFSTLTQHIDEWDSIIINEDILYMFNFILTYDSENRKRFKLNDSFGYDILKTESGFNKGIRIKCVYFDDVIYAHQLQNIIYSLSGQELTIKE
jgi:hypothetical protein